MLKQILLNKGQIWSSGGLVPRFPTHLLMGTLSIFREHEGVGIPILIFSFLHPLPNENLI